MYLLNLLVFEGIGRGFDVFKEYIKDNGTDSIICQELPGPTTYIRVLRRGFKPRVTGKEAFKLHPLVQERYYALLEPDID